MTEQFTEHARCTTDRQADVERGEPQVDPRSTRQASTRLGEVGGHVTLLEWLRGSRLHRQQGGLRGGRVRRLRGDGGPPGRRGLDPVDRDQRLPGAGRRAGQPGGHHRGGARPAGRAAPGAARDGRPRRVAMWLLHTGFHLLDGLGVLPVGPPAGRVNRHGGNGAARAAETQPGTSGPAAERCGQPTGPTRRHRATHPTTSTARTASTCTRCPETCAAAPATGRSGTPPTRWARPMPPTRC